MYRTLLAAAFGAAVLGFTGAAAYAEEPSPPEPYTAHDPVYATHPDHASVTYNKDEHIVSGAKKMESGK